MLSLINRAYRFLARLTGSWKRQDNVRRRPLSGVSSSEPRLPASRESLPGKYSTAPPEEPLSLTPSIHPSTDPTDNKPWTKLAAECVDLFDEIDSHLEGLHPAGQEMAEHVCLRLQELLQRCDVELIDQGGLFEQTLHQAPSPTQRSQAELYEVRILSPGFRIGRRILRRARVELLQEPSAPNTGESS